jgi:hypothetical protein
MFTATAMSTQRPGARVAPEASPPVGSAPLPDAKSSDRRVCSLRHALLLIPFLLVSAPSQADPIRVLFERNVDGQAGNDLAVVSFPTLADLVGNTTSLTQFTQIDIDPNYSVSGFAYDSGIYRILFERNVDGQAGNDLAVVSFPTLADLVGNTTSLTQFTQIDIDPNYSVAGFLFEATQTQPVSEPATLALLLVALAALRLGWRRTRSRLGYA